MGGFHYCSARFNVHFSIRVCVLSMLYFKLSDLFTDAVQVLIRAAIAESKKDAYSKNRERST